ncbi:MAG: hypothetical protein R3F43_05395 [bacterium]
MIRTAVFTLICALPAVATADRFTTAIAAEGWNDEVSPVHGIILLAWDTRPLWRGGRLGVELNTDTLRFSVDGVRLNENVEIGAALTSEFRIAGLQPDYYRDGVTDPGRGFWSSYLGARAHAKARIAPRTWLDLELGGRRFLFNPVEDGERATNPALVLPPNAWIFEPRVRYTWWNLADDAAWRDRHRLFPRLRGVAAGLELGVDARADDQPWGALDAEAFPTVDPRNAPDPFAPRVQQWLMAGWQILPWVRTQLVESAMFGEGGDDLTRQRIGGAGPYSVNLPGAPWASWLSERYVAGLWSWHFEAMPDLEVGPMVGAVVLADPGRVGADDEVGTLVGLGGLVDWRTGPWQVDLRGGYSPSVADRSGQAAFSVWLGGGYVFELEEP